MSISTKSDDISNEEQSAATNYSQEPFESTASIASREELVREETLAVRRSKIAVFFSIILAGIGGTVVTYYLVKQAEQKKFNQEFQSFAREIEEVSEFTATQAFGVIRSLSKSITALTLNGENSTFPFVTLPYFSQLAEDTRAISGAEIVALAPLVHASQKEQWEAYATNKQGWIHEGLKYRGLPGVDPGLIPEQVYDYQGLHSHKDGQMHFPGYHLPVWQVASAPTNASIVNLDLFTRSSFESTAVDVIESKEGILSDICDFSYLTEYSYIVDDDEVAHPQSYILEPVFESFDEGAEVVAFVIAIFPWNNYFKNIFPDTVEGVDVVVDDQCGDVHTYRVNGPYSEYAGKGAFHEAQFSSQKYSIEFATFARFKGSHPTDGSVTYEGAQLSNNQTYEDAFGMSYSEKFKDTSNGHCEYRLDVYPSSTLEALYLSSKPMLYSSSVAILFTIILTIIGFYDCMVTRRQRKLLAHAERTKAIVSSLFPKNVQERIMEGQEIQDAETKRSTSRNHPSESILGELLGGSGVFDSKPIADFFPNTTIMFADLAGFTAWSSTREPTQVFTLLEIIYNKFDSIARAKGVFKVETVGDCYVAAVGLPDPCENHAVVMADFARSCLSHFHKLVRQMEVVLGPDTADLGLRVGIHSGPVTAGVLRGEKSRFQLFGDTVNTASRIESTGEKNRIQISEETAVLLIAGGMEAQVNKRHAKVSAKGKGEIQTWWLDSTRGGPEEKASNHKRSLNEKEKRNIQWNYQNLRRFLIPLATQQARDPAGDDPSEELKVETRSGGTILDEVQEIISLPADAAEPLGKLLDLQPEVDRQLYKFVKCIGQMYRDNPFHNFDHASHVTMSVTKLLSRVVAPDMIDYDAMKYEDVGSQKLHNYTHGITSDSLTQFACAFSALIHDAHHLGVPNATLVEEKHILAEKYKNKSVAEQNSVDVAWNLLMGSDFKDLRRAVCKTQDEFVRFRQLVVNMVMATDIVDKELGALRKKRWETAFSPNLDQECSPEKTLIDSNRKATIVIEHLIQASDVAHTMQHWHVYLKWNKKLFEEMYEAFMNGRLEKDPSVGWYQGELGFFDFYIIPLARKLKECGVFGVASDEYLNYAEKNRSEWEIKGKDIVEGYLRKFLPQGEEKKMRREEEYLSNEQSTKDSLACCTKPVCL